MIIDMTFKHPEAVEDGISEALEREGIDQLSDEESDKIHDLMDKWFKYGEYVTIRVDTGKKTAEVLKVKDV